jgi:1-aminocyclopropane-1-carboxylate deaminase/D-cysteine desulfhydrase-like pyridoxal-dependent ACC family enzyme
MQSHADLLARLDGYPRLPLADYPTPLEPLPRLSRELKQPVYIKRDDQIGPGLGGNKTRKLEYLLADARGRGARKIVTFGGLQSNHARITAAAGNQFGLETHLFYFARRPEHLTGNLLLNQLLGARLHFIPFGGGDASMTLEQTVRLVRIVARAVVGRHYFIPVGGHSRIGCLGYVRAAVEIDRQARDLGIERAHLLVPVGSGGTLAGLMAGLALCGSQLSLLGIDVGKLWKSFPQTIGEMAGDLCRSLGETRTFAASQVPLIEGTCVGPRYGAPSEAGGAAIRRLAECEGILLDPIYTGKAFARLLNLCGQDAFPAGQPVIFLHTGGLPALFAG